MREAEEASGGADSFCSCACALCVGGCCCCVPAGGHGACVGVVSTVIFLTKKDRIWPALREASTPQMLRALYAAISLRFGKFLISDPGVSLFGILPLFLVYKGRCSELPFRDFLKPDCPCIVMLVQIPNSPYDKNQSCGIKWARVLGAGRGAQKAIMNKH